MKKYWENKKNTSKSFQLDEILYQKIDNPLSETFFKLIFKIIDILFFHISSKFAFE